MRGGTTLDLSGTGVGATTTVWFGSTAVTHVTRVSSTRVRVVTPAHPAGVASVRVTTPAGTSPVSSRSTFAFDAVPTVSALSSRTATTRGGTLVTLTGTGLYRASAVRFGSTVAAGLTRLSATQVRVAVPAHTAGAVDVRVTTPGGTSPVASAARFTYTRHRSSLRRRSQASPSGQDPCVAGRPSSSRGPVHRGHDRHLRRHRRPVHPVVEHPDPRHHAGPTGRARQRARADRRWHLVRLLRECLCVRGRPDPHGDLSRVGPRSGGATVTLTGTGLGRATAVQFGSTTTKAVPVSRPPCASPPRHVRSAPSTSA